MPREWQSTGDHVRIDNPGEIDRIPDFDPRTGDHLWIVAVAFRVDPAAMASPDPSVTPMLDHENLLSLSGPGCYYCERPYTARLASRRCKGQP